MCDTFVALKEATRHGGVILAKSADTEINEAQQLLKLPRRRYPPGSQVRVTHLVIPQAEETYEAILDRSFWLYGGEIGVNEHGVAVGNEAVFSNQTETKDGVILIDLLRLIVERTRSCDEAVDLVAHMLKTYGQGGNCELRGNSHFDGSFIVSDRDRAVVIETAGRHWAVREVKGFASISNGYTICNDWDRSSLEGEILKPDFGARFGDAKRTRCVAAVERQRASYQFLKRHAGAIAVRTMADLLRDTGEEEGYEPMTGEHPTRICMHAAPYENRLWQATGALISDTRGDDVMAWVTATSGTDTSIFKPVFFGIDLPDIGPQPRETYTEGSYWWRHEFLHRRAMADYAAIVVDIRADFEALENEFFEASESVRHAGLKEKESFQDECWRRAMEAEAAWISRLEKRQVPAADPSYRAMWDRFNRAANFPLALQG
jgi:dipeptidase